jgi:Flp pilus assembly protein TadG
LNFRSHVAGAVIVEAAFIVPIFLLFCMGAAEFGRLYWIRNSLQYSVDQVARYALAHKDATASDLRNRTAVAFGKIAPGGPNVNVCGDNAAGDNFVTITATYQFRFLGGFVSAGGMTLRGRSRVPLIGRETQLTPACS